MTRLLTANTGARVDSGLRNITVTCLLWTLSTLLLAPLTSLLLPTTTELAIPVPLLSRLTRSNVAMDPLELDLFMTLSACLCYRLKPMFCIVWYMLVLAVKDMRRLCIRTTGLFPGVFPGLPFLSSLHRRTLLCMTLPRLSEMSFPDPPPPTTAPSNTRYLLPCLYANRD